MKKWLAIPLVLLIVLVTILGSCGTTEKTGAPAATLGGAASGPAPASGQPAAKGPYGTIRAATTDFSYESTDPIFYESFWGWSMYDNLISYDKDGNYVGNVAESWTISPDGNTWTFKIRKDIKWWDGTGLTANDVKFSVDRFGGDDSTNPWSRYISKGYNKKSSAVVDDYTFQYVSDHPEPALVIPFAWTRILPKTYFEKVGQAGFRAKPMGSGPWKFVEHTPETSFTMEANTSYWGQVPAFQFMKNIQVPEESTQVAMLQRNEIDLITVNMDRITALQKAGWKTMELGLPVVSNFNFQGTWMKEAGPTNDIRIRQAMSYALNRQEICNTYYQGNAVPSGFWFVHPGGYGWTDALKPDPYDLAKAKALLKDANYPAAFKDPVIHIMATAAGLDYIQLIQSYWTEAGMQVKIEVMDAMVWGGYFFNFAPIKPTDKNVGWIWFWTFGSTFNNTYHSANMFTKGGAHNTSNDDKATAMYKDATGELDPAKALKKWQDFLLYARSLYISIGVVQVKSLMVVGPMLGEFKGKNWMSLADAYNGIQHPK